MFIMFGYIEVSVSFSFMQNKRVRFNISEIPTLQKNLSLCKLIIALFHNIQNYETCVKADYDFKLHYAACIIGDH